MAFGHPACIPMPEGQGSSAGSFDNLTAVAASVRFADERLVVQLVDGRELSVLLEWFPRLREASEAERTHWRLIGQGTGIYWPDVDVDISVPRLLGLPCE